MVETDSPDRMVALALNSLLTTAQASLEVRSDFVHSGGPALLARILDDAKCNLGLATIKTMLDHACTKPVLLYDAKKNVYRKG
jgi:hypothetical protein